MEKVYSKDGTSIAFDRLGAGPAVVLVDGALCSREFGPMPKIAPLLAKHFTVITYDRRGRGDSGDGGPYAVDRELDDLEALIRAAGGRASLVGLSSGAALCLEAAARGLPISKVVAYEPPYMVDDGGHHSRAGHRAELERLVAAGRRGDAVKHFMRRMVGVPAPFVWMMRLMAGTWRKLEAVAHTLPYDAAVMGDFGPPPRERFGRITVPTLVMHGGRSDARLVKAAHFVADTVPDARLRVLEGQTHDVKPEVLVPAVVEFLAAPVPSRAYAVAR